MGQHLADASLRSGLPQALIRAVAEAESGGAVHAISPKGAMGLMQIMPATWRDLRADLGLGDDPFDPRDNLLAGAVYLRRMLDRFGAEGFLGAYNAGPSRYQAYLDGKQKLPAETIAYVARVRARLPKSASRKQTLGGRISPDWRGSDLFVSSGGEAQESEFSAAKAPLFSGVAEEATR
ncbi:lytic transglycosylase domain-containing protein [Caulobacter segnis]|nr:lytic transglycosylase domain-containing protein [Caulobacter segnis]AVQ04453.1 lytic transglycosylase domain-containing protein [Caulobacter segnis]